MIKNIIWDVDGTLFDTYPAIVQAFIEALNSLGVAEQVELVSPLAKVGLSHCAHILASRHGLAEDQLAERFGHLYGSIPKARQVPFQGATAVCEAIVQAGGVNAIATHRGRASTEQLLSVHKMRSLFAQIVAADDGLPKKPDPASFLAIMSRQRLDPQETAGVGDRDVDALAGKAAGVLACLFSAGPAGVGEDVVFAKYSEFLHYVKDSWRRPTTR